MHTPADHRRGENLRPGAAIGARRLTSVSGDPVAVPDPDRLVHLQFRRFAGCPICNLHLRSVVQRHAEIANAGIREVVVFHSTAEELREHVSEFPFAVIPDPDKRLYREFGVESSPRALLSPRAWAPTTRAVLRSAWMILRGLERPPAGRQPGGRLGLPADFLLAPDGRILAAKYGEHAYDQWSVDQLLALASQKPLPSQDPAGYLKSYIQEMGLGDEDPATVIDRYHTQDIEWLNDGTSLDRDRLIAHARPARRNATAVEVEVHDALVTRDRIAARYTLHATMRKGRQLSNEIYLFGELAPDGRLRRIHSTTRDIPDPADAINAIEQADAG